MDLLDGRLSAVDARQGFFLRRDALAAGYGDAEIQSAVRRGIWSRIRRGAYADAAAWKAASLYDRHRLLTLSALAVLDEPAVASHVSAAVLHGLPVWGIDLREVDVSRGDLRSSRTEGGVHHHAATLPPEDLTHVDGVPVTVPTRTVIDVSREYGFESGVVTADAALRAGATREELLGVHVRCLNWPGALAAGRVVSFADGRSGSVGESRARVRVAVAGLPVPETQVIILDARGELIGVADMLIREFRTVIEFDGLLKYGVDGKTPAEAAEVLRAEKVREERMSEAGFEVVRLVWSDLESLTVIAERIRRAFARAALRPAAEGLALPM